MQGSRSGRKRKYNYANYHKAREAAKRELNNERSLERSRKKSEVVLPSLEERTRRIEYGPPLFNVGDVVTIMKDIIFLDRFLAMTVLDRFPVNT